MSKQSQTGWNESNIIDDAVFQEEDAKLFRNLLNRKDHDIDYAYTSRITPTADPAFTDVFHPVEPFQVRFGVARSF